MADIGVRPTRERLRSGRGGRAGQALDPRATDTVVAGELDGVSRDDLTRRRKFFSSQSCKIVRA